MKSGSRDYYLRIVDVVDVKAGPLERTVTLTPPPIQYFEVKARIA